MKFEEKLRKQMLLKGYNQQTLARLSRVSDSEISRILSGKSGNPGLENALRLARAVGVSLDYLADDRLEHDPIAPVDGSTRPIAADAAEEDILLASKQLGLRPARRILETVVELGYEVAIRRLLHVKPLIELGDPARTAPVPASSTVSSGDLRVSSG